MDNYLMFNRLLKCKLIPEDKVHPATFKGAEKKFSKPKAHLYARDRHNKVKTASRVAANAGRSRRRAAKSLSRLGEKGISFEYPGLVKIQPSQPPASS